MFVVLPPLHDPVCGHDEDEEIVGYTGTGKGVIDLVKNFDYNKHR